MGSCSVPVLSVRLDKMPPLPHTADPCDLDEERKKELIMEKKLRACRVNIISRPGGYFSGAPPPPPVVKKPPAPTPIPSCPSAVQKASNPIALRYWNQCNGSGGAAVRKTSEPVLMKPSVDFSSEAPPWVSSNTPPPV